MEKFKYKFSVIIPVYNVEKYLEETILSVINQTIGFKKNIQIILVNDGSKDNSEEICIKYSNKYKENIKYIKQQNSGVSEARNNGLKYVQGKYVNFLDSDDTWSENAFKKVYHFFEKHYDEIDMVAGRMRFFEAIRGFKHALDYKFKKDEVVDIKKDYDKIQLSASSAFFKTSAIENMKYDKAIKYAEDANFISKVILKKEKYGSLRSVVYNYRKRYDNTSAIQTGVKRKEWYNDTVEKCYKEIFKYSENKYGKVIPYFQYQIMYDLQWRLKTPIGENLSIEEKQRYIDNIKDLLAKIDNNIILEQRSIPLELKLYALSLKYNKKLNECVIYKGDKIYFDKIEICKLEEEQIIYLQNLDIENGKLKLNGQINCTLKEYNIYFQDNNQKKYEVSYYESPHKKIIGMEGTIAEPKGFKVDIPINDIKNLQLIIEYGNSQKSKLNIVFTSYAKLNRIYRNSYYAQGKYIITYTENETLNIEENTPFKHFKHEVKYMVQLLKGNEKVGLLYRILYYISGIACHKPIWIISDRPNTADDNGMHMFKYLVEHEKNAKIYFAILKNSDDYKKIKEIGNVLDIKSLKYKLKLMHASKVISSQANEYVINASKKGKQYIKDLYKFDFVFLQHGIIKNDLSDWLNRSNKNIKLFITSSPREYKAIIQGNYNYDESVVKLTGLPRYDSLNSTEKPKKQIAFMPTWRKKLAGAEINSLSQRMYNTEFKNSEYCEFYNKLINDSRLINALKEKGYTGKFFLHPTLIEQYKDFQGNDYIEVYKKVNDYQKEFKENAMLITDYSSVSFDFAYLKKPVIFTQFDIDSFFEGQL